MRTGWVACVLLTLALGVAACGDDGSSGSGVELKYFIFNEPGGGPQKAAAACSKESQGRYSIKFEYLPARADQQREQLVRRLGAEDKSIDLIGMDIIWTGEFANAGWLAQVPDDRRAALTENVFDSVLETAQFEDKLYNVPAWSNTQLLWYRKDRVDKAPETWDEMLQQAEEIGPAEGKIQVQAKKYEGLVVWANAMIESAGTQVLTGPEELKLDEAPTKKALETMAKIAGGQFAPANIDTSDEDTGRLGFEAGDSTFMINYPFVFPSAKENAPKVFEQMAAAKYPGIEAGQESKPPLGGINIGVSAFSKHKDLAFEAIECMIKPENQIEIAKTGGLPPVREDLYEEAVLKDEIYPGFADVIRESIRDAAPRPSESPAYQDLSLAMQDALHPAGELDGSSYDKLKENIEKAIKREGLL